MPDLPERKVGIIACSGEELAVGTVSRLAALRVLHELRPGKTVTICLPLFLAGGEGDRAFARFHPTITVDGCELRCAARGTEMYSGKPTASIVVSELAAEHALVTYELPTHQSPFCILQKEYGYVGYPLYLSLLVGAASGLGAGVLRLFRNVSSLEKILPRVERGLALVAVIGYSVFCLIVGYKCISSNLKM